MTDIIDDIANCKGMGSVKWEDYDSNSKNLIIEALCKKVKELESKFNSETKASYEELEIAYSKVDKIEAKLSESGVKWDFRLDELNGFIEEQNKKLSDNTIVKRFMETEDHFKMTLWMMFETVLRNEKELQSLTLPFGEEGLTNVESHKHLWNKMNTIDNNISGKVKGLEAVVRTLITELERRGAGSICEFYKGLLAQLAPSEDATPEPTLEEATRQLLETIRFKPKEPKPTPLSTTEMNMRATAGFTEPYKTPDSLLKIKEQDPLRECVKHLDGTIEHRELKEKEPPSEPFSFIVKYKAHIYSHNCDSMVYLARDIDEFYVKRTKVIEKLQDMIEYHEMLDYKGLVTTKAIKEVIDSLKTEAEE